MYNTKMLLGLLVTGLMSMQYQKAVGDEGTTLSADTELATEGGVTTKPADISDVDVTGAPEADDPSGGVGSIPPTGGAAVSSAAPESITEKGIPADAEGTVITSEVGTTAADGASVMGGDSTSESAQVAPMETTAATEEDSAAGTAAAGAILVTSRGADEAVVTTATSAVAKISPATTRSPPEATYAVTSIPVTPYLIVNGTDGGYTGYIIDVLDKLALILNVEFKLQMVSDGKYGKKNPDGTWTGMIGEIIRGEADLAAAPLTVTVDRDEVVDFTHPVFKYSAAAIISHQSPFSAPRFRTLEDLISAGFKFAVTRNSNIHKALADSTAELDVKVMESITANDGLKDNNNEGVRRARSDPKYAFLMESGSADWISHQVPCDLTVIPTEIYKRKYAFAIKNLSPLRDVFNRGIVKLQELGVFEELRDKWFRGEACSGCDAITGCIFNMAALICLSRIYRIFWS